MELSLKQKAELARRRKIKAMLLEDCAIDEQGRKLCPKCGKLPDYRGLSLSHKKSLAQGGRTSKANCEIACFPCHGGPEGHRTEGIEHSQSVDRPLLLAGMKRGFTPWSKSQSTGIKEKEKKETR